MVFCFLFIQNILIGPTVAQDTLWKVAKEPYTPKGETSHELIIDSVHLP